MSAVPLVEELTRRGLRLEVEGDELRCRGAKKALTPELLARLKESKPEILAHLRPSSSRPCRHGVTGGCWLCKKYGVKSPPEKTIREIVEDPPYWIKEAYLPGYRKGTISLNTLAGAVAAAQGRSAYEWADRLSPEVRDALEELGLDRTTTPAVLV